MHSPGPIIWTLKDLTTYLRAYHFFVTLGVRKNSPKTRKSHFRLSGEIAKKQSRDKRRAETYYQQRMSEMTNATENSVSALANAMSTVDPASHLTLPNALLFYYNRTVNQFVGRHWHWLRCQRGQPEAGLGWRAY